MKRKLNDDLVPTPTPLSTVELPKNTSFESFGLDRRLLQSVVKEGFSAPTSVQSRVIPLVLEGKDLIGKGSHPYAKGHRSGNGPKALILVPTRELSKQVYLVVDALAAQCSQEISAVNLTQKVPETVQRSLLASSPNVIVSTPARAALNLNSSALSLENLSHIVIDEADLVLSYGYEEDLQTIAKAMHVGSQGILMSATLTTEIDALKRLFCGAPVMIELEDTESDTSKNTQYVVKYVTSTQFNAITNHRYYRCTEDEKFLLLFVIFKLKLVKGKCIIFVADTNRCYRVKLFMEQFGIKSCVLNSELPVNSRIHVVEEFNKGVYDIIVASDDQEVIGNEIEQLVDVTSNTLTNQSEKGMSQGASENELAERFPDRNEFTNSHQEGETVKDPVLKRRKTTKKGKEYGISRGIDFKNVACVLNFDLPTTFKSYTHRIGRTARGGKSGIAISFVVPAEHFRKHKPTSISSAKYDEEVMAKITRHQAKKGKEVKPYHFDLKQIQGFQYRINDALRAVTPVAIREARVRELRQELLKSEKLKRYFEENPDDLRHLRHDGEFRTARIQAHLKHVPDYLIPNNGGGVGTAGDTGFVGLQKMSDNRIRKARMMKRIAGKSKKLSGRIHMPKKRAPVQPHKPTTPVHPSLSSKPNSHVSAVDRSVNNLLHRLRISQTPPAHTDEHRPSSNIQSVHPSLNAILQIPDTPGPRLDGRLIGSRRRGPPGPAPPRSWLDQSKYTAKQAQIKALNTDGSKELVGPSEERLPGLDLPGPRTLLHQTLKALAERWNWHVQYNQYYLATIPVRYKQALLSYIANLNRHDVDHIGLETLFLDETQLEGATGSETVTHLDLSVSVGNRLKLKDLKNILTRFATADYASSSAPLALDSTPDCWDMEESLALPTSIPTPRFPSLTHLSLSYPHPNVSWRSLLALSPHLSTLTHLSLAGWPLPSLTPNSTTAYRVTPRGPVSYGTSHFYSALDGDYNGAASVMRRLCRDTYCLRWLDLTACSGWVCALGYTDEIEWCGAWSGLETVKIGQGRVPGCLKAESDWEWARVLHDSDETRKAEKTELLDWLRIEKAKREMVRTVTSAIMGRSLSGTGSGRFERMGHREGRRRALSEDWDLDVSDDRSKETRKGLPVTRKAKLMFVTGWEEFELSVERAIQQV
ncbi:MAG: hypothetical protein Q9214_003211 [Letrouitia sp. 1 TL-2023]